MPPPRPPKPEEVDEEEEEEEDEFDMEEGIDMFDAISSLLTTEEGETIAMSLSGLKNAAEKIATGIDMHNKILLKILSEMKARAPPPPPATA